GCARRSSFPSRAGEHQYIEPTVVVVVEESGAATNGLHNVRIAIDPTVDYRGGEAGGRGYVGQGCMEGQPRRLAAGFGCHSARSHLPARRQRGSGEHTEKIPPSHLAASSAALAEHNRTNFWRANAWLIGCILPLAPGSRREDTATGPASPASFAACAACDPPGRRPFRCPPAYGRPPGVPSRPTSGADPIPGLVPNARRLSPPGRTPGWRRPHPLRWWRCSVPIAAPARKP